MDLNYKFMIYVKHILVYTQVVFQRKIIGKWLICWDVNPSNQLGFQGWFLSNQSESGI